MGRIHKSMGRRKTIQYISTVSGTNISYYNAGQVFQCITAGPICLILDLFSFNNFFFIIFY